MFLPSSVRRPVTSSGPDSKSRNASRRGKRVLHSAVESLENRLLFTTITYTITGSGDDEGVVTPSGANAYTATTLRGAIDAANAQSSDVAIAFSGVSSITLGSTLNLTAALSYTIGAVNINGDGSTQAFNVQSGVTAVFNKVHVSGAGLGGILNGGNLTLNGAVISNNADGDGGGGGIRNGGTLTLTNCTVSGNTASGGGGGIYNTGLLNVTDSTISGNTSTNAGGAIENYEGTANFVNTTITGNAANSIESNAGAIFTNGSLSLKDCTVSGNTADFVGGIDSSYGGTLTVTNTIIAGNFDSGTYPPDVSGAFNSLGYNIIGVANNGTGWTATDYTGSSAAPIDPGLSALASNGGQTQTMALQSNSVAIDHGHNANVPKGITTDQRGQTRIQNGTVDIGAYESLPPDHFAFVGLPATASPGTAFSFTIEALTPANAVDTGFTDYSAVSSSDSAAGGLGFFSFSAGKHTVTATLNTLGSQTFSVFDETSGGTISNATSSAIQVEPALSISDATVAGGAGVPITFTVTLSAASSSTVTAHYAFAAGTAPAADFTGGPGTLTFTPGQVSKTISATINGNSTGASEAFTVTLSSPTNATLADASGTGTILSPGADLAITNTNAATSVTTGSTTTFLVTLINNGPGGAKTPTVTDLLPAGLTFVSATPSTGTYTSSTGKWTLPTLASGASATLSLVGKVTATSGTLTTTAAVASTTSDGNTANNSASKSVSVSAPAVVNTTTALGASTTSTTAGSPVTLTATVAPVSGSTTPTGTVSFYHDGILLGTATVQANGTAVFHAASLPVGSDAITANYGGSSAFASSTSSAVSITVAAAQGATQTSTILTTLGPSTVFEGTALSFTASVVPTSGTGTPTGTITFFDGTTAIGTMAVQGDGSATLITSSLSAQATPHSVTAVYSGDASFKTSTSQPLSETVNPQTGAVATTTTLIASALSAGEGAPITFTATVTAPGNVAPTGTVSFTANGAAIATVPLQSGGTATFATTLGVGSVEVVATYNGDASFAAGASAPVTASIVAGTPSDIADPSFAVATDGAVTVPFTTEQVVPEADGEILAVGYSGTQGAMELLNADGSLDTTFGSNGIVLSPGDLLYSAAIDPASGDIVAVGTSNGDFFVERFDSHGVPVTSFGNSGAAFADFGTNDASAYTAAIEPSGSIVVAGSANNELALARFTAGGVLDSTFASMGEITIPLGTDAAVEQVLITGTGRIVGVASNSEGSVSVFRLNQDGSTDANFGSAGFTTIPELTSNDASNQRVPEGIAFQPGGALLVTSEAKNAGGFAAVRILTSGQLDTAFGTSGIAVASFNGAADRAGVVTVDPTDGAFLLVGTTVDASANPETALAAFNADGTTNIAFGTNGHATFPAPASTSNTHAYHPLVVDYSTAFLDKANRVVVGARNTKAGVIQRTAPVPPGPSQVGATHGKARQPAPITLANGTTVTITFAGGSGTVAFEGNQVMLENITGSPAITIRTKGGANTLTLGNLTVAGKLRSLNASTANVTGTISAASIGVMKVRSISGVVIAGAIANLSAGAMSGSIDCAGTINVAKLGLVTGVITSRKFANFTAAGFSDAMILAGVNLGSDGELGGSGTAADSYSFGTIQNMKITGTITGSFIGTGINPVNGIFGDGDDIAAGPNVIVNLSSKHGADPTTHFESSAFGNIRLPGKTLATGNPKFIFIT